MSDTGSSFVLPIKILVRALLNIALVWYLATVLDQYLQLTGGFFAILAIGALLTLLNLFIRPILNLLSIPVRLLATLVAIIIVNGIFLWILYAIAQMMDPSLITLEIEGGIGGWLVLSLMLGVWNWVQKLMLRA